MGWLRFPGSSTCMASGIPVKKIIPVIVVHAAAIFTKHLPVTEKVQPAFSLFYFNDISPFCWGLQKKAEEKVFVPFL